MILVPSSVCKEVACIFGEKGEYIANEANITNYKGSDIVSFTTASGPDRGPSFKSKRTEDSIREEIDEKINRGNQAVRDEGLKLVGNKSGARRIDQISSIYNNMVGRWTYVDDWKGLEQFQYSNYTLTIGKDAGSSGKGDCDDFSILLASLIESIGGTPRIILAYSPSLGEGHAYTEVYLGKADEQNGEAYRIIKWLKSEYNVENISYHKDLDNGDLWLNMDWWKEPGGAKHPGGPFYQATNQIPIPIQKDVAKTPLTAIENQQPIVQFNYTPLTPRVGEIINFDASKSQDPDGKILNYEWSFGDGDVSQGISKLHCPHIYQEIGKYTVKLAITDDAGATNTRSLELNVTELPPEAAFTYSPSAPNVGEAITFDASQSRDKTGQITNYLWDFGDGNPGYIVSMQHKYLKSGSYNVKLTVTNDKGIKNSSVKNIIVMPENVEGMPSPLTNETTAEDMLADHTGSSSEGSSAASPQQQIVKAYSGSQISTLDQGRYKEAIQPDSNGADAWYNKGSTLFIQGRYDEANQAFDKAIQLNPNYADAWNIKGNALVKIGRYDEAIQAFDKVIEINPQQAKAWYIKGNALKNQGRYDEAIRALDKAIELSPKYADAWYCKGYSLDELGKFDEALFAYERASIYRS